MKRKLVGFGIGLLTLTVAAGCSPTKKAADQTSETATTVSDETTKYELAMKKGNKAAAAGNLTRAAAAYELALEYKVDDQTAEQSLKQITLYEEAAGLNKEKKYTKALAKLKELTALAGGSPSLRQYGDDLINEISDTVSKEAEAKLAKKQEANKAAAAEKKKQEEEKQAAGTTEGLEGKETEAATGGIAPAQTAGVWNAQKSAQLASLMSSWGATMGQSYLSYSPGADVSFYGAYFPSTISSGNIAVGGSRVAMQWSTDGATPNVYNVVGVYSDIDTSSAQVMNNHLYLFAIYNGQAVALITQQNQGNNENLIYFNQTQNADLQGGFAQIVGS